MQYLRSHIFPFVTEYLATLQEAFTDINDFIDEQLESELVMTMVVGTIIATPIAGLMIFLAVISATA